MRRRGAPSSPNLPENEARDWNGAFYGNLATHDGSATDEDPDDPAEEWVQFHCDGIRTALRWIRGYVRITVVMAIVIPAIHVYKNGFGIGYLVASCVVCMLLVLTTEVAHKLVQDVNSSQVAWLGWVYQWLVFAFWQWFFICWSLTAPTELMQHRIFLTTTLPLLCVSAYVLHVPTWVNVLAFCPIWMAAWLCFHHLVGFLNGNPACVCFAFFACMILVYMQHTLNKERWESFQTTRALKQEQRVLKETQVVLHGMLSSLWDASCTCSTDGAISSSTPHLNQLLGAAKNLVGSNLCTFAVSEVDAARLQEFLQNVASASHTQALSVQCALHPQGVDSQKDACEAKAYDAVLYGIKLPLRSTFQAGKLVDCKDSLFVGIKASAPEATIAEASSHAFTDDFNAAGEIERSICHHSVLGSLSWSESSSGLLQSMDTEISSIISGTVARTLSEVSIQTDPVQSTEVAVQAGAALPPRIPRPAPQHRRPPQVTLRSRKLAMNGFSETPSTSVKQLLNEILFKINPRGKGCCYLHVGLLVLQHCVSELALSQCDRRLKPYNGWQCMLCLGLNPDDPDFDIRECCVCGFVSSVAEDQLVEEEIDSLEADVESPSVATDSDSLTGCT